MRDPVDVEHVARVRLARSELEERVRKATEHIKCCDYEMERHLNKLKQAERDLKFFKDELESFNARYPEE